MWLFFSDFGKIDNFGKKKRIKFFKNKGIIREFLKKLIFIFVNYFNCCDKLKNICISFRINERIFRRKEEKKIFSLSNYRRNFGVKKKEKLIFLSNLGRNRVLDLIKKIKIAN